MTSSAVRTGLVRSWPLVALLLIAAVWLVRTPFNASNLDVQPDTVEYTLAPLQFLETGRYEIIVDGRGLPPRYPPWFPVLVILPAYVIFGHDPGNAILPVTLMAITGIGFAYAIGKRLASATGGVLAALAVLMLPSYSAWATQPMTDVPCTALMLGLCFIFLNLRARQKSPLHYFGVGAMVAITTLFRPVFAAMLLPFLFAAFVHQKGFFLRTMLLLAPMAAAAFATLAYNSAAFGSPFRNGYKFWTAVPMDYPSMIFSFDYLRGNFAVIALGVLPILLLVCVGSWLLIRKRNPVALAASRQSFQDAAIFLALTTVPILLFHLFYFFPQERFHIPMLAGAAVLAGSMLALLVGPGKEAIFKVLLPAMFLIAVAARIAVPQTIPLRRLSAERVRELTPENAIVISAIDPVYLARLGAYHSSRRIIPLSRNVEYASKVLVAKRIDGLGPCLLNWDDKCVGDLMRGGAQQAIRFVASEQMEALAAEVVGGTPVFFDTTVADLRDADILSQLQQRFKFVWRASNLYELQLR